MKLAQNGMIIYLWTGRLGIRWLIALSEIRRTGDMEGASGRHAHQQCDDVQGYLQLSGTLRRMTNWSAAPAHTEAYNVHAVGTKRVLNRVEL